MIVLFMDDQQVRHDLVEKLFSASKHIVLHAFNAIEALEIIKNSPNRVGLALLDHDLMQIVEEEDGRKWEMHGVWFVSQMLANIEADKMPVSFIIHSYNAAGAKYMYDDLVKNGHIASMVPFSGDMLKELIAKITVQ
jgi:CheY-like chemotaxis protein